MLALQTGVIYGPVNSRRYGRSQGINLMPCRYKLCSFNCVYCHYGWTQKLAVNLAPYASDLPSTKSVTEALSDALKASGDLDLITFSGNGEPTLHPEFPALVDEVARLRDRLHPEAKIALLSNATGLGNAGVRAAVGRIDLPVFKLDAGSAEKFLTINRPAPGVSYESIVDQLTSLGNILLQTIFLDGSPANTGPEDLRLWRERLRTIRPREVHIYSIDRPVPNRDSRLVPPERLAEIAAQTMEETGIPVRPFSATGASSSGPR